MEQYNSSKLNDLKDFKEFTPKSNNINMNSPQITNNSNQSQFNQSLQNSNEQRVDPFTFNQIEIFLQQQVK